MAKIPVADLHCDLLAFLGAASGRSVWDDTSRGSVAQLRDGGVRTQVLPIFVPGGERSHAWHLAQVDAFERLLDASGEARGVFWHRLRPETRGDGEVEGSIGVAPAIENAAGLGLDTEPVAVLIERLRQLQRRIGPFVYVSLTWALGNRFGGGNAAQGQGLTDDGRAMIDALVELGIPLDLSHTSARLADEALRHLDKHAAHHVVLASHCNLRAVKNHARNLSDDQVREVARRGGLIGLTYIKAFVGDTIDDFIDHVRHARALGVEGRLCLGADFFYAGDLSSERARKATYFFPEHGDASCHQDVLRRVSNALEVESAEALVNAMAGENLERFLNDHLCKRVDI